MFPLPMATEQRSHWDQIYSGNPSFFGDAPSLFGVRSCDFLSAKGAKSILELGPGQGRDTKYFADKGMSVIAMDYSEIGCAQLSNRFGPKVSVVQADLRQGLPPMPRASVDACYSHMFFTMDLSDDEVMRILAGLSQVVTPEGYILLSVRNTNDPDFGKGINTHGNVWENEKGFAVRYYSETDVRRLFGGFDIVKINEMNEGRKVLYGVVLRNRC
jgi:SAM-dependent methyltransferase